MARHHQKTPAEDRYQRNQYGFAEARRLVGLSPLGRLQGAVNWEECSGDAGEPEVAAIEPDKALIRVNLRGKQVRDGAGWAEVLGHLLLHLGLNHAARREDRDPLLWNLACDAAVNKLLPFFGLSRTSSQYASADQSEEEFYEELLAEREAGKSHGNPGYRREYWTYAGKGRPDIIGLGRPQRWMRDWQERLAEGIRISVERAVRDTAETLGEVVTGDSWGPSERARRWVMNEFPLLGALAPQIRIIADAKLCERMDISVAAVDGYLGEMYFHPSWNFSQEEWTFIYVHELLHVALLHHSRSRGRDPWVWNLACDFVINAWLVEMGVGELPSIGALYDPRLQGMSADEVYDLLLRDGKRCKGARGFRGKVGDVLLDRAGRRIYRDDVTTLDDLYRRCLTAGMAAQADRGLMPAGLLEEIRSLFSPPPPWDVALGRWMEEHVPSVREPLRSYARASRRQGSTPDIPRPARYIPQEWLDACTFGVVMDTSGSMDRELLGRALGTIASYAEARDVPRVRLVLCDAAPYDQGFVSPSDLRGIYPVKGRGGTVLQPAVSFLGSRPDFPSGAPIMIITDGWCEEQIVCAREHCFVLPRKSWKEGGLPLRSSAPMFRILKEAREVDD